MNKSSDNDKIINEPNYYVQFGLSPLEAMENGLLSNEQYIGFLKGNIIKYIVRAGYKDNAVLDLNKAEDYLICLKNEFLKKE